MEKKHGRHLTYYPNGNLYLDILFDEDKRKEFRQYTKDGKLKLEEFYDDSGKIIQTKIYDKEGKKVEGKAINIEDL